MSVECQKCGRKELFEDSKDVTFAKWKILGWNVGLNIPICYCNKCESPYISKTRREIIKYDEEESE